MILRVVALLSLIVSVIYPAVAQERISVGTQRLSANGALFLAAAQGYFKAEGLELEMTAYQSDKDVADALAAGATELGLAAFTPAAFNYAGRGLIKAVAAQVREKRNFEGNDIVVSNMAYAKGLRKPEDIAGKSAAITQLGSAYHYQFGQIARVKKFDFASITLKPFQTLDAIARAIGTNQVDAAIVPAQYAREMMVASQAMLIGWASEIDEHQMGALFASTKAIETRRAAVEKFVRAYRRGAADYAVMTRLDRSNKRVTNMRTRELATIVARYVYPGRPLGDSAATVESGVYFMDPQARLDVTDIERQVEWYKAQGLIEKTVDAANVVDASLVSGR